MITIREAALNDISSIMLLVSAVVPLMNAQGNHQWDDSYPNAAVFENDILLNQLWVAEDDGEIAGVSAITTEQESEYAAVGWDITEPAMVIHRLAVSINYRGKGIAAALLLEAEKIALRKNITKLRVDTNTQNLATQKLFPKLGYQFAGEIELSFRPGLRFYCYQKEVV